MCSHCSVFYIQHVIDYYKNSVKLVTIIIPALEMKKLSSMFRILYLVSGGGRSRIQFCLNPGTAYFAKLYPANVSTEWGADATGN